MAQIISFTKCTRLSDLAAISVRCLDTFFNKYTETKMVTKEFQKGIHVHCRGKQMNSIATPVTAWCPNVKSNIKIDTITSIGAIHK